MTERTTEIRGSIGLIVEYMDREKDLLSPGIEIARSDAYNNRLVIEGFVEGHPGKIFTVFEMIEKLPFYVSPVTCHYILQRCGFVRQLTINNRVMKYLSEAPLLKPTSEEIEEVDELGRQARADYYDLVNKRSMCCKKKYRVITKY